MDPSILEQELVDLHVKLLKKIGHKSANVEKWENYLLKVIRYFKFSNFIKFQDFFLLVLLRGTIIGERILPAGAIWLYSHVSGDKVKNSQVPM